MSPRAGTWYDALLADDSNDGVPFARAVELREENALPFTENELTITHRTGDRVPGQHSLDMRVRISLGVAELIVRSESTVPFSGAV